MDSIDGNGGQPGGGVRTGAPILTPGATARSRDRRASPFAGPRTACSRAARGAAALLLGAGLGLLATARPALAEATAFDPEVLRQHVERLRHAGDPLIGAGSQDARNIVAALYERRGFAPLWTDPQRALALREAVAASVRHGLDPRDYHAEALAAPAGGDGAATTTELAQRELVHTDAFMRLAYHLYFGRADPRQLLEGWNFERSLGSDPPVETLARLIEAADPAAELEGLAPKLDVYRQLQAALAALQATERAGGWPRIDGGAKLEAGASGPQVLQLRARLAASAELDPAAAGEGFDEAVEQAVRRFQERHGLEVDGKVGRATLAALNVPVAERIVQLRVNLDRLRWVARELKGDILLVDIAGYTAYLWLDGRLAWSARVVVGQPFRTTPEFRATVKYLVLNPEWAVPPTVLRKDVLPRAIDNPDYLARQNMRLVDAQGQVVDPSAVDWNALRQDPRAFRYQIVQAPGEHNALGQVKIMFPNEHAVYLHDTPARQHFERTQRAFSSGCIRIDRPLELATLLIDDPQRWPLEKVRETVAAGRTQTLPVPRAVPVLLLYFTAIADDDGRPRFRPDVYGRDRPIARALAAPFRYARLNSLTSSAPAGR